jgi:hypothetical protein
VSSYDALGSMMAMPIGAVIAGPIAAWAGVAATQYGAAALIVLVSLFALMPRDIRTLRADQLDGSAVAAAVAAVGPAGPAGAPVMPELPDEPALAGSGVTP